MKAKTFKELEDMADAIIRLHEADKNRSIATGKPSRDELIQFVIEVKRKLERMRANPE